MIDNLFKNLNFSPVNILDQLYQESLDTDGYYLSPADVLRRDVSENIRKEIAKIINVPFADCGFLKTNPGSKYPVHKDIFRIAAINMPLFEPNDEFKSFVVSKQGLRDINYVKDNFLILNVLEFHGVVNYSQTQERIMLSIGIKERSYQDLLDLHDRGLLINAV